MKRLLYTTIVFLLALVLPAVSSHGDEPKGVKGLMQRKLEHSQKVLEGIALGDFNLIAKHGDELISVSQATEWRVLKSPQFELHSNEFRRNAEALVKQARAKNLDGATLAYVDLTLNCVKCHKYVREVRMTRGEGGKDADGFVGFDPPQP